MLLASLFVAKAFLVSRFLRARAWWRLDSAGASAPRAARNVVSLLDAAAYLRDVPDDDPDIVTLDAAGCFRDGVFDPGPQGAIIVREWQLADEPSAGPADLLAQLARAAHRAGPGTVGTTPGADRAIPAAAVSIPRQPGTLGPVQAC